VQYAIDGYNVIGWESLSNCKEIYKNYDELKGIAFFNDKPDFNVVLKRESFAEFFPQNAHHLLCIKSPVKKYTVKAGVDTFRSKKNEKISIYYYSCSLPVSFNFVYCIFK
jgi:beta-galactosidase beta subunit